MLSKRGKVGSIESEVKRRRDARALRTPFLEVMMHVQAARGRPGHRHQSWEKQAPHIMAKRIQKQVRGRLARKQFKEKMAAAEQEKEKEEERIGEASDNKSSESNKSGGGNNNNNNNSDRDSNSNSNSNIDDTTSNKSIETGVDQPGKTRTLNASLQSSSMDGFKSAEEAEDEDGEKKSDGYCEEEEEEDPETMGEKGETTCTFVKAWEKDERELCWKEWPKEYVNGGPELITRRIIEDEAYNEKAEAYEEAWNKLKEDRENLRVLCVTWNMMGGLVEKPDELEPLLQVRACAPCHDVPLKTDDTHTHTCEHKHKHAAGVISYCCSCYARMRKVDRAGIGISREEGMGGRAKEYDGRPLRDCEGRASTSSAPCHLRAQVDCQAYYRRDGPHRSNGDQVSFLLLLLLLLLLCKGSSC